MQAYSQSSFIHIHGEEALKLRAGLASSHESCEWTRTVTL
jgi:hypothetical protein